MKVAHRPTDLLLLIAAVVVASVVLSACGGGGDDPPPRESKVAFAGEAGSGCDVGSVSPVKVVRVGSVITMRTPPLILSCGTSAALGNFYIVGFDTNHGICVAVDSVKQGKTYGVICRDPRTPWLDFCEKGPGCVLRNEQDPAFTLVLGLTDVQVKGLRASIESPGKIDDVTVADVSGDLLGQLNRKEAFGLFAVALPGCEPIDRVRMEMLDADGAGMGLARESGGLPSTCK